MYLSVSWLTVTRHFKSRIDWVIKYWRLALQNERESPARNKATAARKLKKNHSPLGAHGCSYCLYILYKKESMVVYK